MGSISLPALHVNPPEQQNPLNTLATLMQMKREQALLPGQVQAQQQQLEAGQQENQMRAQQIKDQQAMTAAMQEWDGKDVNALPALVVKHGASANAVIGLKKNILDQQQTYSTIAKNDADTGQKNLDIIKQKNDNVLGAITAAESVPDDQLGSHLAQTVQGLTQQGMLDQQHAQTAAQLIQGIQSGQVSPAQARQALDMFKKGLQSNSQQIDTAAKQAETAKNNAQAASDTANAAKTQLETDQLKQFGGLTQAAADAKYRFLIAQQKQGVNITPENQAFIGAYEKQKTLVPVANLNLQGALLSDAAKQMAAENYAQTGQLPAGMRSPAMSAQVLNRAASGPNGIPNIAANKMAYHADTGSLASLQKNFDNVSAFENTAGKNLDVFLNQAKKVVDSGSPWINRPLRSVSSGMLGSDDQAAFNAARTTAVTEIAKVLNSSNASGVLSDSARHEVEGLIGPDATLKQIVSAANILKTDMANRHQSYQDQINAIKGRQNNSQPQPANSGGFDWNSHPKVNQ